MTQPQSHGQDVALKQDPRVASLMRVMHTYRGTFERLLPATMQIDADTFLGAAAAALYRSATATTKSNSPKLIDVAISHPDSLIIALRETARLGHIPGTKECALGVRDGQVVAMEQYQGVKERMFRSTAVVSIHAEVVCKGERFIRHDPNPPEHLVDDWFDRDLDVKNLHGAYAYAMLTTGGMSNLVHMGRREIMAHRAVAKMHGIWDGPFGYTMWVKTVLHRLENFVPVSVEYAREQARIAAVLGQKPDPVMHKPVYDDLEGTVVNPEEGKE